MTRLRSILLRVMAAFLYLATLALGLLDIYFIREIVWALYARFSAERTPAILVGDFTIIILAIAFMVFVVFTGEYHLKHASQPHSWKLFGVTFAVEFFIPILAYFMG